MSENQILSREEFVARAHASEEEMTRWLKLGLLVPAGKTAGKAIPFSSSQINTVEAIRALQALGYDDEKIARIVR